MKCLRAHVVAVLMPILLVAAGSGPVTAADWSRSRDFEEPMTGEDWFRRGFRLHHQRNYSAAIDAFSRAIDSSYRAPIAMYNVACGFAMTGRPEKAFEWLDRALVAGISDPEMVIIDEDFRPLRSDPRWAAIAARALGLAEARRLRGRSPKTLSATPAAGLFAIP